MRNIVFFGTDRFAANILKSIQGFQGGIQVVTPFAHENKLPCPVKQFCLRNEIKFKEVSHPFKINRNSLDLEITPDSIGIVVSFGYLIPEWLIHQFDGRVWNIHPSDLPKYRGPAPIHHTLLNGERSTRVCMIELARRFDEGNIVLRSDEIGIGEDETFSELYPRLNWESSQLLTKFLELDCLNLEPIPQSGEKSFAPKLGLEDSRVNWNLPSVHIYNQYRAMERLITKDPHRDKNLFLRDFKRVDKDMELPMPDVPGCIAYHGKKKVIQVKCGDGKNLEIQKFQYDGKARISAEQFSCALGLRPKATEYFPIHEDTL